MRVNDIRRELQEMADPEKAKALQCFFKTGPGQYGEGDVFLGITVPESRKVAKKYSHVGLEEIKALLNSAVHEERMVALLVLVQKYKDASGDGRAEIAKFYLDNLKWINNWDLVDLSAPSILGSFLMENDRSILYKLARSGNVWERRIAIVSTLQFIRSGEFDDTLKIAEMLLHDGHDLMHKAAGWMLREVGKRDASAEEAFLEKHCQAMPRTMLRYAIERFPEKKRVSYMRRT
jgi:3-methyladenine DNA glycosylase AlkD